MLKARDTRRNFCPPNHWLSEQEDIKADKVTQLYVPASRHVWRFRRMGRIGPLQSSLDVGLESPPLSVSEERQLAILTELPFVVPFEERVKVCTLVSLEIDRVLHHFSVKELTPTPKALKLLSA